MKPEGKEYVRYRIARAKETMADAKLIAEHGHIHSAANRLYYACFYIVSALLFTEGLTSTKHSGVRSLFDRQWIKTGRLPGRMSEFYRTLFNYRQQADYADRITFSEDDVKAWIEEADQFIDCVLAEIEKALLSREGE